MDNSIKLFPFADHKWEQFRKQITPASVWLAVCPVLLFFWFYANSSIRKRYSIFKLDDGRTVKFSELDDKWVPDKKLPPEDYKKIEYFNLLKKSDR